MGRGLLFAGVAAACLLGVSAGLWARPAESERHPTLRAHRAAAADKQTSSLQIVVDEHPAPLGQPLEVMPAASAPTADAIPQPEIVFEPPAEEAPPAASDMAPRPSTTGLVRVQAITSAPTPAPAPTPAVSVAAAEPAAKAKAAPKLEKAVARREAATVEAKPAPSKAAPAKSAPLKSAPAKVAKPAIEKVERKAPKPAPPRLIKAKASAEPARPKASRKPAAEDAETRELKARLQRVEARLAKAERAAKPKLTAMVRNLTKTSERKSEKAAKPQKVSRTRAAAPKRVERPAPERELRLEKPGLQKAALRHAAPTAKPAPVKVVRVQSRCGQPDPGAALVCKDPSLGAVDRELGRAYRQAEAAGVPGWRLAQQQQRWLAARANAAREAPWAVRDVYQARIAELHDMTRSAQRQD